MSTDPRWTEDTENTVQAALSKHLVWLDEVRLTCDVDAAGLRRDVLAVLADLGVLFPPGGSTREERGMAMNNRIVSTGWKGDGTHRRRVTVWPDAGPNDGWPRYNGPWELISETPSGGSDVD